MLGGGRYRFCQQCNKFQAIDNFSGNRRSCKARSEDRNLRRRKQRTDERALAGDSAEGGPMRLLKGSHPLGALAMPSRVALTETGMLRQLSDPNEAANQLGAAQYANQVQQLLLASGGGAAAGLVPGVGSAAAAGSVLGGPLQLQLPPTIDLAAALAGAADLGLGGATSGAPNANALSLLTAAAHGAGRGGAPAAALSDPTVGSNVLQQLQLAQLASALAKGSAGVGPAGMAGLGMGLGAGAMGGGLSAAGVLGTGLNGGNLAHQLLLQQAASAAAAGVGSGGGAGGPGMGVGTSSEAAVAATSTSAAGGMSSNLNLMAQQLLQQTATSNSSGPLLLLSNQNVMLLSLDQLGLLPQSSK
ncbi:hypothetical protein Vafri_4645 [Volvox africanus]|uniref:SBP-type domain-containing protein n=1 Tax=Volvox africanus TaxID=51714 RepID=A0A8J4EWG9_9CHLO|nr:hypothetical protein Vafri_4645 [Volvox africanus]